MVLSSTAIRRIACLAVSFLLFACSVPLHDAHAADSGRVLRAASSSASGDDAITCMWSDYQRVDGLTTPKKICLTGYGLSSAKKPDGYLLYRKGPGQKDFRKLATIRKRSWTMKFTDRKVKFAKTYRYRFRAFRTVGGKKVLSPVSKAVKMRAVYQTGKCSVEFLTERGSMTSTLDLKIASGEGNGTIVFRGGVDYLCRAVDGGEDIDVSLDLTGVSSDGVTWRKAPKKVSVAAGATKYLRFTLNKYYDKDTGGTFLFEPTSDASLDFYRLEYNGFYAYLATSFTAPGAIVAIDGEYYH